MSQVPPTFCTLLPTKEEFEYIEGKTLLESAEIAGVTLPFGCRAGSCGACFVYILEGANFIPMPSPVETDTLQKLEKLGQGRLACRIKFLEGNIRFKVQ